MWYDRQRGKNLPQRYYWVSDVFASWTPTHCVPIFRIMNKYVPLETRQTMFCPRTRCSILVTDPLINNQCTLLLNIPRPFHFYHASIQLRVDPWVPRGLPKQFCCCKLAPESLAHTLYKCKNLKPLLQDFTSAVTTPWQPNFSNLLPSFLNTLNKFNYWRLHLFLV